MWTKKNQQTNNLSQYIFVLCHGALELLGSLLGDPCSNLHMSCGVGDPLVCGTLVGNNPNCGSIIDTDVCCVTF